MILRSNLPPLYRLVGSCVANVILWFWPISNTLSLEIWMAEWLAAVHPSL